MTILNATRKWVSEFNAIPYGVVEKLMRVEDIIEVTPIVVHDAVRTPNGEEAEVIAIKKDVATVQNYNGETSKYDIDELYVERYDSLPMWGTFWSFDDICDKEWLETHLQKMAECGFRIYEQEDYGYIFGIDGAGYDFYEAHWIPLYKARGLKWHDEDEQ